MKAWHRSALVYLWMLPFLLAGASCARGATGPEIKVATWNLYWFPSGTPEKKAAGVELERIKFAAQEIRKVEPDILCLQEVRDTATAEALCKHINLPKMQVVTCSAFPAPYASEGTQQVAILSSLPVLKAGFKRWTTVGAVDPPRGFAYAILQSAEGPVAVFCVHLKSNFIPDGEDKAKQTKLNRLKRELASDQVRAAVAEFLKQSPDPVTRILIVGDFNTSMDDPQWKGEKTLRNFGKAGYASCFEGMPPAKTITMKQTAFYPAVTFDYIWHRGFKQLRKTTVHPHRYVSDHAMVSAVLEL